MSRMCLNIITASKIMILLSILVLNQSTAIAAASVSQDIHKCIDINVAVAANFQSTLEKIAFNYTNETGCEVGIISGSTGQLFAKIGQGAPYDIFLSADSERVLRLFKRFKYPKSHIFTYAIGRLAYWNKGYTFIDKLTSNHSIYRRIKQIEDKKLVIPNPKVAPYGKVAQLFLQQNFLTKKPSKDKIINASNVLHAFSLIQNEIVSHGFVSYSSLLDQEVISYQYRIIDSSLLGGSDLLEQKALLLLSDENKKYISAERFFKFLQSSAAKKIILKSGYRIK